MIVCHCRAISDRTIRASIRDGASTLEAVCAATGASGCCGGCEPVVSDLLDEELGTKASGSHGTLRPLRLVKDSRAA